jgi:tetratricopeptide (TPR) repeat protein
LVFCLATPVAARQGDAAREAVEAFLREGKYSEAISSARQLLEIREAQFGPGHPGVVYAINWLARAYEKQGRFRDAEPLYRRALAIRAEEPGRRLS